MQTSPRIRASSHSLVPSQAGPSKWLLIILTLLLVELTLLLRGGILVLLVLRDQVVHVRLRLRELHLVHALARVPMQECLAPEHSCEVFRNALEHLLDGRRVPGKCNRHLETLRRDVTD